MENAQELSWRAKFGNFIKECRRVLRVTKKPDKAEFITIVKVSALGIALIGLIGFIFQMGKNLLFGSVSGGIMRSLMTVEGNNGGDRESYWGFWESAVLGLNLWSRDSFLAEIRE